MSRKLQVILSGLLVSGVVATITADEQPDEAAKLDALLVKAQKIRPVCDPSLDSMGGPVKAEIGGAMTFLCCPSCSGKIKADTQRYLATVDRLREQHFKAPDNGAASSVQ